MIIENAFGLLKNKFPRVHSQLNVRSPERAGMIIETCMHLQNFILNQQSGGDSPQRTQQLGEAGPPAALPSQANEKRDFIRGLLSNQ